MKRGDIYYVDFGPSRGAEIRKKRPALVISCDEANKYLKTVTVIPFSSRIQNVFPFEVLVDKTRLTKYVGTVHDETLAHVEKAIKLHLALD